MCLDSIEGIRESAVIGLPHPDFGEAVVAVITADPNGDCPQEEALIAELRTQLSAYKLPKRVLFVDELPRNAMGKVQKNRLREDYADLFS